MSETLTYTNWLGETLIPLNQVKIIITPHTPFVPNQPVTPEKLAEAAGFCRGKTKRRNEEEAFSHHRASQALKNGCLAIYRAYFIKAEEPVIAFTEVGLSNHAHLDCLILGPQGAIIIEIKRPGTSSFEQLTRYKAYWERRFPEIPALYLRAAYSKNKVTLRGSSPSY